MNKETILDYATKTPENTNRSVLGSMLDQFAKGGSSGGGGIEFLTIPVTNVFEKEVVEIDVVMTAIKGNTSFPFGSDNQSQRTRFSEPASIEVPMFGEKARFDYISAYTENFSVLIPDNITATGNVNAYMDSSSNEWVIEVSGEGTISITWIYQD